MRKFFVAAASLVALAACGQTTTPATTTETPAEVAATTTGPTNAADATAQDTCGAAAFQSLVGQPATTINLGTLPSGTRILTRHDGHAGFPRRLNIIVGTDGNVGSPAATRERRMRVLLTAFAALALVAARPRLKRRRRRRRRRPPRCAANRS
jgi:hypothetical protein